MTTLVLLLGIAAIAVLVVDVMVVRRDGYGTTTPPRSHLDWDEPAPLGGRRFL